MKQLCIFLCLFLLFFLFSGCQVQPAETDIVATTLPVYEFTKILCQGTNLNVTRLINEPVSCLHDYSLTVSHVQAIENAKVIVLSGGGLEDFMADLLNGKGIIDASKGIALHHLNHTHEDHAHEEDAHFWLSPALAKTMADNICEGLVASFPQYAQTFRNNLPQLHQQLDALQAYGQAQLSNLSTRNLITFHDGFSYFSESFGLTILKSVEEESGSEISAQQRKELITLIRAYDLPALFTERNGSTASAEVICAETGASIYILDMAISGNSYFDTMYRNIDTIKEALG